MRRLLIILLPMFPLILAGCAQSGAEAETLASAADYTSFQENTHYVYEGTGNEYASYDMYVDYVSGNLIQHRIDNGGTTVARVLEVRDIGLVSVRTVAEAYYRDNLLGLPGENEELLIAEPLREGTTWSLPDGKTRSITDLSVRVTTPSGDYDALEVTTADGKTKTVQYYAKGIGLVKSEYTGEEYSVSSSLAKVERDAEFRQNVTFYLPDADARISPVVREVRFHTNDVTADVLAAACRAAVEEAAGRVLSADIKINSLYKNSDGAAAIDVSAEALTEMNAGAAYEQAILQCVANTLGAYYDTDRVLLTVEGKPYESGHIKLAEGEYLKPDLSGQ